MHAAVAHPPLPSAPAGAAGTAGVAGWSSVDVGLVHLADGSPGASVCSGTPVREVTLWAPIAGTAMVTGAGASLPLAAGALVVTDSRGPDAVAPAVLARGADGCTLVVLRVPRGLLAVSDAALRESAGRSRNAGTGVGALLVPLLQTVARERRRSALADRVAQHLADLLAALVHELSQAPHASGDRDLMDGIRWYINQRLDDPALRPETIAAAHFISVRLLHKLFEQEGTTLGRWLLQRRLHECRRELGRVDIRPVKVAAVARRWGFANTAHFSRAFRRAYGISPRDWRDARTG
ncbi:helix-turn-helix domain-containing protein [Streptomyces sp. NPDC002054]|uniref:helix-turn-helix domain-containing protein n=1 Tax=Streptomyces sp. NPDC002054 TaxID=3154663 RepID=UPI00331A564E